MDSNRRLFTYVSHRSVDTLRPRQNGQHFANDMFKRIFMNEKFEFSLIFHGSLLLRVQLIILQHRFR